MMGWSVLALVAIAAMVVSTANSVEAAISCPLAVGALIPCKPFLIDGADKPTPPCCAAVKKVKDMAGSKADLQALCECLKKASASMGVDPTKAEALPGLCGVSLPFPIKPDIDCSKLADGLSWP